MTTMNFEDLQVGQEFEWDKHKFKKIETLIGGYNAECIDDEDLFGLCIVPNKTVVILLS